MDSKDKDSKLFSGFPGISPGEWRDKVVSDLNGADFNTRLGWRTGEGFTAQPFYTQDDLLHLEHIGSEPAAFPYVRGNNSSGNRWKIRQNFRVTGDPVETNLLAVKALERGAESLGFNVDADVAPKINREFLNQLLAGISIPAVDLHFTDISDPSHFYKLLTAHSETHEWRLNELKGSLGYDPIGQSGRTGKIVLPDMESLSELITLAENRSPLFKIIGVNPHLFQDGGSTLVQELAFGLSMAVEYVDRLTSTGISPGSITGSILFTFAAGPNYFMEIAKLRAARWLWSVICREWGVQDDSIEMNIHSQTATWNLSIYDPYVNVLRSTTETMSASLGGSNTISVHPFDHAYRDENQFSSRVSRNIQVILREEAYFDKVADPAAGSYYIESLTDSIAEQAWKLFLETESGGGYLEAFKNGFIQEKIGQSLLQKREGAATRRIAILGVNQYPNFNELVLQQLGHRSDTAPQQESEYKPITPFRIGEQFEALRIQTEKSGRRPKVFLLKYGDPVWRGARAMFSGNFFAAAGYEIIDSPGFESMEKGIDAALAAKAEIVVLCSADEVYGESGPTAFTLLNGKAELVIAGYPKESVEELKRAGLNHFISMKSNLLEELKKFQEILGIAVK